MGFPRIPVTSSARASEPGVGSSSALSMMTAMSGRYARAILGETNARLYKYERRAALATDRVASMKAEYEQVGPARSNLRYGYIVPARG